MSLPITFHPTDEIPDVLVVETRLFRDERGYFAENFVAEKWRKSGLATEFVQDNLSLSAKGTLRGMHYQIEPYGMGKYIRTVAGSVFDVAVDLRSGSPTFGKWVGRTLSAENGLGLWIPSGFAHGFLALEDNSVLYYKCTASWAPGAERALNYADPEVAIAWPEKPSIVSPKDEEASMLKDAEYNFAYLG